MKTSKVMLIFAFSTLHLACAYSRSCFERDYGQGSVVCVCNATYCDTAPKLRKLPPRNYFKVTSNQEGLRFYHEIGEFILKNSKKNFTDNSLVQHTISVDPLKQYQPIDGWGGAFTDATGYNMLSLSSDLKEILMGSYFGDGGIGFNLCRVPMACSDFSTRPYTYLDDEDPSLSSFALQIDDFLYKIPFIQEAINLTRNSLKLVASPWAAPLWMKTDPNYSGPGAIKPEYFDIWAKYFEKFLAEYRKNGIEFWGITTGNEPSLSAYPADVQTTPTVAWSTADMNTFIKSHLGPILNESLFPDVNIIMLDDQRGYLPDIYEILNDSTSNVYIQGIGVHWYQDFYISADLLDEVHDKYPDKFILGTEACLGSTIIDSLLETHVVLGSWSRAEQLAKDIIEDINHWVTGWMGWNLVLNTEGGPTYTNNFVDAHIIVNSTANEFYKQPTYYAHGHFSKFIPQSSRRIYIENTNNINIYSTAFKRPDDGIVIVILNSLQNAVQVNIKDGYLNIMEELSPKSLTTFLYWKT